MAEEHAELSRKCLDVAFDLLAKVDIGPGLTTKAVTAAILQATQAAECILAAARRDIKDQEDWPFIEIGDVVAAAWWAHLIGMDDASEVEVGCAGGAALNGFAHAAVLLKLHEDLNFVMEVMSEEAPGLLAPGQAGRALDALERMGNEDA